MSSLGLELQAVPGAGGSDVLMCSEVVLAKDLHYQLKEIGEQTAQHQGR